MRVIDAEAGATCTAQERWVTWSEPYRGTWRSATANDQVNGWVMVTDP